jgi:eukaryotic-like serine/threonine-protein kinase
MSVLWVPGGWIGEKYQVAEFVGKGGMAEVWRGAMHGTAGFARGVAFKRILPEFLAVPEFVRMFVEEATILSQLVHANIVQVFDFERDRENGFFLVMEWVEGLDLRAYLKTFSDRKQRAPWPIVTGVVIETLRGLAAAHERVDSVGRKAGIIHRDVTPQNILLGTSGTAKLTDFGLARVMGRARQTNPGVVKGKLAYLAPELARDEPPSVQSDLFSLGVVLWESLAGRPLYSGQTDGDVFERARKADIPPLGELRDDLPSELLRVVDRVLARDPADRFASARDFLRRLARILRNVEQATDSYAISHSVIEARCLLGRPPPGVLLAPPAPAPPPKGSSLVEAVTEDELLDYADD